MTNPINSYDIGDATTYSITALMQSVDMQRKGYSLYQLLNADSTGQTGVCANSVFNINGSLYYVNEDTFAQLRTSPTTFTAVNDSTTIGNYYILAIANGADLTICIAPISSTTISYNLSFGGWYESTTQNLILGGLTIAKTENGINNIYSLKWIPDKNVINVLEKIYCIKGYDVPIYRLQNIYNSNIVNVQDIPCLMVDEVPTQLLNDVIITYPCSITRIKMTGFGKFDSGGQRNGQGATLIFKRIIDGVEVTRNSVLTASVTFDASGNSKIVSSSNYFDLRPAHYNAYVVPISTTYIPNYPGAPVITQYPTITNVNFSISDVMLNNDGSF